jgi:hypothetical protein
MAVTAHHTAPSVFDTLAYLAKPFAALGRALIAIGDRNSRYNSLNQLMALSDAELAERGLKRDQLVRRTFSDSYYL